jgi:hypothetical protein
VPLFSAVFYFSSFYGLWSFHSASSSAFINFEHCPPPKPVIDHLPLQSRVILLPPPPMLRCALHDYLNACHSPRPHQVPLVPASSAASSSVLLFDFQRWVSEASIPHSFTPLPPGALTDMTASPEGIFFGVLSSLTCSLCVRPQPPTKNCC